MCLDTRHVRGLFEESFAARSERLIALRVEAGILQHEYRYVFRDNALSEVERHTALNVLTGEIKAIVAEARLLIYGVPDEQNRKDLPERAPLEQAKIKIFGPNIRNSSCRHRSAKT